MHAVADKASCNVRLLLLQNLGYRPSPHTQDAQQTLEGAPKARPARMVTG